MDFFRVVCPLLEDEVFLPLDADELFFLFLLGDVLGTCDWLDVDEAVWAGNPLPCTRSSETRLVAVNRLKNIGNSV